MSKNNEKTEWMGLWNNRQGVYSGQIIKKADIPNYARLIVRFNKFYEKDGNKPRFVYCFASGDAHKAVTMDSEEYREARAERVYTEEEVYRVIHGMQDYYGLPYGNDLIEDFI